MNKSYGIVIDDTGMSQINTELAYSIFDGVDKIPYDLCTFFLNCSTPYIKINSPLLNALNISKFYGAFITTSALALNYCINNSFHKNPIYHFSYNLEWTILPELKESTKQIMSNPNVKVIARCVDHAEKIKEDFGIEPIFIVNEFDLNKILKGIEECQS